MNDSNQKITTVSQLEIFILEALTKEFDKPYVNFKTEEGEPFNLDDLRTLYTEEVTNDLILLNFDYFKKWTNGKLKLYKNIISFKNTGHLKGRAYYEEDHDAYFFQIMWTGDIVWGDQQDKQVLSTVEIDCDLFDLFHISYNFSQFLGTIQFIQS